MIVEVALPSHSLPFTCSTCSTAWHIARLGPSVHRAGRESIKTWIMSRAAILRFDHFLVDTSCYLSNGLLCQEMFSNTQVQCWLNGQAHQGRWLVYWVFIAVDLGGLLSTNTLRFLCGARFVRVLATRKWHSSVTKKIYEGTNIAKVVTYTYISP